MRGTALGFRQMALGFKPLVKQLIKIAQLARSLILANAGRFESGKKMLANGWKGEVQVTRNRADAFFAEQMSAKFWY